MMIKVLDLNEYEEDEMVSVMSEKKLFKMLVEGEGKGDEYFDWNSFIDYINDVNVDKIFININKVDKDVIVLSDNDVYIRLKNGKYICWCNFYNDKLYINCYEEDEYEIDDDVYVSNFEYYDMMLRK